MENTTKGPGKVPEWYVLSELWMCWSVWCRRDELAVTTRLRLRSIGSSRHSVGSTTSPWRWTSHVRWCRRCLGDCHWWRFPLDGVAGRMCLAACRPHGASAVGRTPLQGGLGARRRREGAPAQGTGVAGRDLRPRGGGVGGTGRTAGGDGAGRYGLWAVGAGDDAVQRVAAGRSAGSNGLRSRRSSLHPRQRSARRRRPPRTRTRAGPVCARRRSQHDRPPGRVARRGAATRRGDLGVAEVRRRRGRPPRAPAAARRGPRGRRGVGGRARARAERQATHHRRRPRLVPPRPRRAAQPRSRDRISTRLRAWRHRPVSSARRRPV